MTNPPIPPAVVEAVELAIYRNADCSARDAERAAPFVIAAALATGSVVICTPELRRLMEAAVKRHRLGGDTPWRCADHTAYCDAGEELEVAVVALARAQSLQER